MKKYEKILVGIERELYVGSYVDEKSQFSYPCENERIVLIFSNGTHLTIWEEQDICPSGYTTCTYGRWKRGKGKRPFSYRMKGGPMQVTIEEGKDIVVRESQTNEVIACTDYDGGDEYYPQGEIYLDFELFTETARRMEGRPVWIFSGTSALGKSTLGALLAESGKVVYETEPHVRTSNIVHVERIWWMLVPDPFVALADVSGRSMVYGGQSSYTEYDKQPSYPASPLGMAGVAVDQMRNPQPEEVVTNHCEPTTTSSPFDWKVTHLAFWPVSLVMMLALGAWSLTSASRRLRTPVHRLAHGTRVA